MKRFRGIARAFFVSVRRNYRILGLIVDSILKSLALRA
jgi:hypothetical protein